MCCQFQLNSFDNSLTGNIPLTEAVWLIPDVSQTQRPFQMAIKSNDGRFSVPICSFMHGPTDLSV